jgi:hypothetical protein
MSEINLDVSHAELLDLPLDGVPDFIILPSTLAKFVKVSHPALSLFLEILHTDSLLRRLALSSGDRGHDVCQSKFDV